MRRPALEETAAAVRVQAAARGLVVRRAVRAVRAVERDAEGVAATVSALLQGGACGGDERARAGVAEELMRLLLRMDAVRGARAYRKRVVARVLALHDALDTVGAAA